MKAKKKTQVRNPYSMKAPKGSSMGKGKKSTKKGFTAAYC